ncbi:hypothetical protein MKX01_038217 [Papaver californicum]|nr:hypothetical protein MKX01_038217 [Papaver californicum]
MDDTLQCIVQNDVQELVNSLKPIGISIGADKLLREEVFYGNLFLMFWNTEDKELQNNINTNKHGIAKLLMCYDRDDPSPSAFKFGDKFIESTPEKCAAILGTNRVGGRKGDKIINKRVKEIYDNLLYKKYFQNSKKKGKVDKTPIATTITEVMRIDKQTPVDDEQLVCLMGFYMCYVLFSGDTSASSIHVKYLGLVENLETVKKVSWPDMIHGHFFNEILDNVNVAKVKGCVPYLLNRETILPRVGRWNVYEVSNKTDMS